MGNQAGKTGHRSASIVAADRKRKASRTNWTAGVPSPPGRPVVELSSVRVEEHDDESVTDEINLTWAVPQDDGGFPITGYRVEMLDLGSGCWIEITCIEGYEPKCTLSNILYGIMYRFRIIAVNDAGSSTAGEPSDPIVIDVPGVQIAPYFVQMLNDAVALEHEKIEFRVRVLGTPKPTLQWYKDDVEIFPCDRIEMHLEDEGGAVLLKGARLSDSGVIKCVANNVMGKAVSVAQFDIEAAPRLEVPENYSDGLVFRQDEVIRLKVPLVARPPAKVVWFFEDEPISSGTDVHVETTDTYTSLRIQSAKRWHTGEFRVYAENDNGEDAASILVTVTAAPSPPGKPVVIDISETKCTLRWEPSSDDGGADIRHYVIEYHRDVWEVWLKATTAKDCQVVIDGLIPGSREASEASDPFDVATISSESLLRNREMIPKAPKSRSWLDLTDRTSTSFADSEADFVLDGQQFAPLTEETLAKSKQLWPQENKEDILDRFLKVQKFAELKIPSYDSDGLPSVVAINDEVTPSEASDSERARKLYDDLRQLSNDTTQSPDEEESDENSVNGQKRQRLDDDSNTVSMESLASLIPEEKKEALHKFEMTLREMIEEARALAHTPSLPDSDPAPLRPPLEERLVEVPPAVPPRSPRPERRRSMKSPSAQSTNESVVSVIEMTSTLGRADEMPMPVISVTADEGSLPNSPKAQISPRVDKPQHQHFFGAAERSLAWRNRPRSLDTSPTRGVFKQPKRPLWRSRDDEDEEETGPTAGDRFRLNMQRMENSMRGSHPELPSWQQPQPQPQPTVSTDKHEAAPRSSASVSISTTAIIPLNDAPRPKPVAFSDSQRTLIVEEASSKTNDVREQKRGFVPKPIEISIDPTSKVTSVNMQATSSGGSHALAAYMPKNLPQWFIITYVYSAVLIFILIMANITPDGKLYVYFVALWSLIAYAVLDDDQGFDPIETVVQEFLRK